MQSMIILSELLARLVALMFYGVCVGNPPPQSAVMAWSPETGFDWHGPYLSYGFYAVEEGAVFVMWDTQLELWTVLGTTNPPAKVSDPWHVECSGWYFPVDPDYSPDKRPAG